MHTIRLISLFILLIGSNVVFAQKEERKNLRAGNKSFQQENFSAAEESYRKALEVNPQSVKSHYNIGNAIYRQLTPESGKQVGEEDKKRINDAIDQYKAVTSTSKNKKEKAMAWHNIGNFFMLTGDYKQSMEAYKNSLLNNPNDHETRYNYILAKKLLKEQEDQNQNQNENQDQQQQPQNQQQQNQDQQQQQNQDQQQNNDKMSKENAEQILNAIMQEEQETRGQMKESAPVGSGNRPEKDW